MSSNDKAEVAVEKVNENNDKASGDAKVEKGAKRAAEEKGVDAKKPRTDGEENGEEEEVEDDEEDVEGEEEEEEEDIAEEEEDEDGEGDGDDDEDDA